MLFFFIGKVSWLSGMRKKSDDWFGEDSWRTGCTYSRSQVVAAKITKTFFWFHLPYCCLLGLLFFCYLKKRNKQKKTWSPIHLSCSNLETFQLLRLIHECRDTQKDGRRQLLFTSIQNVSGKALFHLIHWRTGRPHAQIECQPQFQIALFLSLSRFSILSPSILGPRPQYILFLFPFARSGHGG